MLFDETATRLPPDADRARTDSLVLWQSLIILSDDANEDDAPALVPAAERCALDLPARYRFGEGDEYKGEICEISPLGLRLSGPNSARPGSRCSANIAHVGIVEGLVVRAERDSFVLGLIAPRRRLRRLAKRLNWQIRRINNDEIIEKRSSERVEMNYASATIETANGQTRLCGILDLSKEGAGLHIGPSSIHFWIGQPVRLDGRSGQVVRTFTEGFAIKFD